MSDPIAPRSSDPLAPRERSNDIHPLPNTGEAFEAKLKTEPTWPKWTEFMAGKVEPAMGKLLDVPTFDPKKPVKGTFSCGNCHKLVAAKP